MTAIAAAAIVGALLAPTATAGADERVAELAKRMVQKLDKLRAEVLAALWLGDTERLTGAFDATLKTLEKFAAEYEKILASNKGPTTCYGNIVAGGIVYESDEMIGDVRVLRATTSFTFVGCFEGTLVNPFVAFFLPSGEVYADGIATFTGNIGGMAGVVTVRNTQALPSVATPDLGTFHAASWSGGTGGLAGTAGVKAGTARFAFDWLWLVSA